MKIFRFLLLVPLGVLVLALIGWLLFVMSVLPPLVSGVAFGLLVVVAVWFFYARKRSPVIGSEASLMRGHRSKDGLL
ncbi:hypothetical protein AB4Z38_25240 [Arthrobacter sp. 2RAF6]|uniref:hypothetical protein n=1 Tax=Arthrobacter sp. 2RAF6 TaxID=3233002 RepID=UPI003F936F67